MGRDGDENFGNHLRQARRAAGLTQAELAQRSGVSLATIRDLEQQRNSVPRPSSVRAIVRALDLNSDEEERFVRAAAPKAGQPPRSPGADPADAPIHIGILGPILLARGGRPVRLDSRRHRLMLARLALTSGQLVRRDELVDLLWAEDVPPSAISLIHTYVAKLRKLLEPGRGSREHSDVLVRALSGYRLQVQPEQLDLTDFRRRWTLSRAAGVTAEHRVSLLEEALGLWRGDPVADIPELIADPLVTALVNERIDATIAYARACQQVSAPERALPQLRDLAAHHRLHEPLQARFIAAVAATGHQAAALQAFHEVREHLAAELGVDPGPELKQLYQDLLHHRAYPQKNAVTTTQLPVPAQVPASPHDFVGRTDPVRRLIEHATRTLAGPAASPPIYAISGVGGVGKTTLAAQVALRLKAAFPDGQLFIDLQGNGKHHPISPIQTLTFFLRSLGVDGRRIPIEEGECAALYRSVLAQRRILIVLDNARDTAQVRPLLPGTGHCGVIVTSRRRLADLEGARMLDLDPLSPTEALQMLSAVAGSGRVAADPVGARELVDTCSRLPIALRVAGGRLAGRPGWTVKDLLARLRDRGRMLDELRVGDLSVETTLQLSYDHLAPESARAFRMLATVPGPDFTAESAAVMLGTGSGHPAEAHLQHLVDVSLLQMRHTGRYTYHDLVRLYAVRRAEQEEPAEELTAAWRRLLEWYLSRAAGAAAVIYAGMIRLPLDVPAIGFPDDVSALAWVDTEISNLVAAVDHAVEMGPRHRAWELVDQLRPYYFVRRMCTDWLATAQTGLAVACQEDSEQGKAAMYQALGQARWSIGKHEAALADYEQALCAAQRSGWHLAAAYMWRGIGQIHAELGRTARAETSYQQALELCRTHGFDYVHAVTTNDLGVLHHEQGRLATALEYFRESLRVNEHLGHKQSAMANRGNLGMILRQLGRFDEAYEYLKAAIAQARQSGAPHQRMSALDELSQLHTARGEHPEAIATAQEALDLTRQCTDPRAEAAVRSTLGAALLSSGELAGAEREFTEAHRLAVAHSYPYYVARSLIGLAETRLNAGALEAACEAAGAAVESARGGGYRPLQADALRLLARANLAAECPVTI